MNLEYFIAKRLFFQKENEKKVSRPAVRIAIIGIAVGLAVMIVSVAVVIGFKHEVQQNLLGISSHFQVISYRSNYSYEMVPVEMPDSLPRLLADIPGVTHVQHFSTKPGMLKTENDMQAVVFKGAASDFDWHFFAEHLVAGRLPDFATSDSLSSSLSREILLSENMASLLRLQPGDEVLSYFIKGDYISARKWRISGLFNSHFAEYDNSFILADHRQIVRLNAWTPEQFGGLEIFIEDIRELQRLDTELYKKLFQSGHLEGNAYYMQSVYDLNPDLFGWLDLLDMNIWLILVLMIFVAGFNMISGQLILILERTNMIGMLKAMGADNLSLRKVFLYMSSFLIGKGLAWGNLIALLLCALQSIFHLIPLDPAVYYVSSVPVELHFGHWLLLNIGTIFVSMLIVLGPSALVARVVPVKAIRFD